MGRDSLTRGNNGHRRGGGDRDIVDVGKGGGEEVIPYTGLSMKGCVDVDSIDHSCGPGVGGRDSEVLQGDSRIIFPAEALAVDVDDCGLAGE
jgi:hypothetical protein